MSLAREFRVGIAGTEVAFNQDLRALVPAPEVDGRYLARFLEASRQGILCLVDASKRTHLQRCSALAEMDARFASLQHRAFRGEL
jgi:hypothetical protein